MKLRRHSDPAVTVAATKAECACGDLGKIFFFVIGWTYRQSRSSEGSGRSAQVRAVLLQVEVRERPGNRHAEVVTSTF